LKCLFSNSGQLGKRLPLGLGVAIWGDADLERKLGCTRYWLLRPDSFNCSPGDCCRDGTGDL
ncbi:MAG: hypothetical protein AAGJ55_11205, partial [Cyanobacteria bacterium J06555_12]